MFTFLSLSTSKPCFPRNLKQRKGGSVGVVSNDDDAWPKDARNARVTSGDGAEQLLMTRSFPRPMPTGPHERLSGRVPRAN